MNAVTETKPDHKSIFAALAAAQMEMGRAIKDSANPAFRSKYADLGNVMDACLPALNKHGIAVIQPFHTDDLGNRFVKTVFIHESGDTMECAIPLILGKNDMQGLGSTNYGRQFVTTTATQALVLVGAKDEDGLWADGTSPAWVTVEESEVGVLYSPSLPLSGTADVQLAAILPIRLATLKKPINYAPIR